MTIWTATTIVSMEEEEKAGGKARTRSFKRSLYIKRMTNVPTIVTAVRTLKS